MDLTAPWEAVWRIVWVATFVYIAVIVSCRLNGLRSFATMSAFDFAMTIAIGSVVATIILSPDVGLIPGFLALAMLFLLQRLIAWARRWQPLGRLVDNRPRVPAQAGVVHHENLRRCHMTLEDLHSKIRQAGVARLEDIALAVMETSGSVSVIRRDQAPVDAALYHDLIS